jgi:hypothetical protein
MKKNILIAILCVTCAGLLFWNLTQKVKALPAPIVIETDEYNVGDVMIGQFREDRTAGTFEIIPPDPESPNTLTHTIVLTYPNE